MITGYATDINIFYSTYIYMCLFRAYARGGKSGKLYNEKRKKVKQGFARAITTKSH